MHHQMSPDPKLWVNSDCHDYGDLDLYLLVIPYQVL